jgi:hypothetical protein
VDEDPSTGTQDTPGLGERNRQFFRGEVLNDVQHRDQVEGFARERKLPSIRRNHLGLSPDLGPCERLLGKSQRRVRVLNADGPPGSTLKGGYKELSTTSTDVEHSIAPTHSCEIQRAVVQPGSLGSSGFSPFVRADTRMEVVVRVVSV